MADKKPSADDKDAALEKRVDQIMDPNLPDPVKKSIQVNQVKGAPDLPEIDIFADAELAAKQTVPEQTAADADEVIAADSSIDNPATDPIVDDIVSSEGNELLAAKDAEIARAFNDRPPTFREKVRNFFAAWWQNKRARYGTFAGLAVLLLAIGIIPGSRYFVLNSVGVRAAASVTVLDETTKLPLKNVSVTLGDKTLKSNKDGVARFADIKLGTQPLTIQQLGFAKVSKTITLGLGSNPLGDLSLKAVGTQFTFTLTDWVSGKPVRDAEVSSGDNTARSDAKGAVVLTVGKLSDSSVDVSVSGKGYRTEKLQLEAAKTVPTAITLVSSRPEVFISKQSGKYDLYKMDIDGKNKKVLLAGSGLERSQISLVPHADGKAVALVSSRENKRNGEGYLLDTLTIVDTDDGSTLVLDTSERIQIVDWIQDRIVYVKTKAGTSAGNAERFQLVSYDYESANRQQLAAANSFADIVSAKGILYFATANYYKPGQSQFIRINPDGTGKQVLLNSQVWSIQRTKYDSFALSGGWENNTQLWYSYRLGETAAKKLSQAPTDTNTSRYCLDAPSSNKALWIEDRDGKGVLLSYDDATKKDAVIATQSGLTSPVRWLDSRTVIYTIATPQETADYVLSLDGGSPRKITDVTRVSGLGRWNYGY